MNDRTTYRDKTVPWSVRVTDVVRYGDVFVRVVSEIPTNVQLSVGDTVAIDVRPQSGVLRRYTVSAVSDSSFEFVAFRTQRGPATTFLNSLVPDAQLFGQGPERPVKLPTADLGHVVVLGDETVVGTAVATLCSTTAPVSVVVTSNIPLPVIDQLTNATQVQVCSTDDDTKNWLTHYVAQHGSDNVGIFLVGEQAANQSLRQHSFGLGVAKERVATRTFWRPDKEGLE